jgi:uracil-DNA glycosylase family 4
MTERWPVLIERLASCRTCHEDRLLYPGARPLFGRAQPERADLLFVLEAPNYSDTFDADKGYLTVDPDTDPSGRFFHELHTTMLGEPLEQSVLTNAVLCLPSGSAGRYPVTSKTMANCSPNLRAQILALEPLIVVSVGSKAMEATRLIENHGRRRLGDAVAQPIAWFSRTLFPVFHTGLLARNGPSGRPAEAQRGDWKRLREVLADLRVRRDRQR